jgi:ELWxxDGT repeat protein
VRRSTVLFEVFDPAGVSALWRTNGTLSGTYQLAGISGADPSGLFGSTSSVLADFTSLNGEVVFAGTYDFNHSVGGTTAKFGLWVSDGTAAGTHNIYSQIDTAPGLDPTDITSFNGVLLFAGADSSFHRGLWVSDGITTDELTGISGAYSSGLSPTYITVLNENVISSTSLFNGKNSSGQYGLWVTDGTAAGTHELTGISGTDVTDGIWPSDITVFGGSILHHRALFSGQNTSGFAGLWVTDGTATGTSELTGISGTDTTGLYPHDMTRFNNLVLFGGQHPGVNGFQYGEGLWVTNGTAAGTHELTGINGAFANGIDPSNMTVFNGAVLFNGANAAGYYGLWITDGTSTSTHELTGINGASSQLNPTDFAQLNGKLVFAGTDSNFRRGLWETDGTAGGTHELIDYAYPGPSGIRSVSLVLPPPDNFNSNNTSDILFRNYTSGDTWFAAMSNGAFAGWNQIGGSNTSYGVVGIGDFYGTGTSDILYRNDTNGDTWYEAMSNGAFAGWHQVGGSDTRYVVAGVGDFIGYGTDDILFRNSTSGDTWFAAMINGTFAGWHQIGGSDTRYSAVGVGDFFESGVDDILFSNNSTGDTWVEVITNGAFAGWDQIGGSDTRYSVVGVGDFFGDGTNDILFRNNTTGDTWFEAISSGVFVGWHQIGGSDTNYSVVGVGDYFGNNTSDILFRNGAGDIWFEAISSGAFDSWQHVGGSNSSYTVPFTVRPPALT